MARITNAVLFEKIENLKEYLIKHNDKQDERILLIRKLNGLE